MDLAGLLADTLRRMRHDAGLSQVQMAKRLGISRAPSRHARGRTGIRRVGSAPASRTSPGGAHSQRTALMEGRCPIPSSLWVHHLLELLHRSPVLGDFRLDLLAVLRAEAVRFGGVAGRLLDAHDIGLVFLSAPGADQLQAESRRRRYATRWHALHRQCRPPCVRPCVGSVGKSLSGFQCRQVEQTLPRTPSLVRIVMRTLGLGSL